MSDFALSVDCLAAPTRFDVAAIELMMLWPDDAETRREAMNAIVLDEVGLHIDEMDGDEKLKEYAKAARSRLCFYSQFKSSQADRKVHGIFAGRIALEAIIKSRAGLPTSLGAIRRKLSDDMKVQKKKRAGYQIEPQTLANTTGPVAKFRPVAHFWAAHVWNRAGGDTAFPCSVQGLPAFLGLAERLRELGETTSTRHSTSTIFKPGEMVHLPLGINPPMMIFVQSPSDTEKAD